MSQVSGNGQPAGSSSWTRLTNVTVSGPSCYFYVPVNVPGSGQVRLAYIYPLGDVRLDPTYFNTYFDPLAPRLSRTVAVTIK